MSEIEKYKKIVEGLPWPYCARKLYGVEIRDSQMFRGKYYLYEQYTEYFVEFSSIEDAEAFRKWADENLPYWDYNGVATIDPCAPDLWGVWKPFIE